MLLSLVMNFIYVSDKLFGVKIVGISNLKFTLVLCFSSISSIFSVFSVSLARSLHQRSLYAIHYKGLAHIIIKKN